MAEKEKEYEEELLMEGFDDESDDKNGKSLKKKRLTSINSMGDSMTDLSEMAMELETKSSKVDEAASQALPQQMSFQNSESSQEPEPVVQ